MTPCLHGCRTPAVATFHLDAGCVVFPDAHEQPLCPHHAVRATPLGGMELVRVLEADTWAWMIGNGSVRG